MLDSFSSDQDPPGSKNVLSHRDGSQHEPFGSISLVVPTVTTESAHDTDRTLSEAELEWDYAAPDMVEVDLHHAPKTMAVSPKHTNRPLMVSLSDPPIVSHRSLSQDSELSENSQHPSEISSHKPVQKSLSDSTAFCDRGDYVFVDDEVSIDTERKSMVKHAHSSDHMTTSIVQVHHPPTSKRQDSNTSNRQDSTTSHRHDGAITSTKRKISLAKSKHVLMKTRAFTTDESIGARFVKDRKISLPSKASRKVSLPDYGLKKSSNISISNSSNSHETPKPVIKSSAPFSERRRHTVNVVPRSNRKQYVVRCDTDLSESSPSKGLQPPLAMREERTPDPPFTSETDRQTESVSDINANVLVKTSVRVAQASIDDDYEDLDIHDLRTEVSGYNTKDLLSTQYLFRQMAQDRRGHDPSIKSVSQDSGFRQSMSVENPSLHPSPTFSPHSETPLLAKYDEREEENEEEIASIEVIKPKLKHVRAYTFDESSSTDRQTTDVVVEKLKIFSQFRSLSTDSAMSKSTDQNEARQPAFYTSSLAHAPHCKPAPDGRCTCNVFVASSFGSHLNKATSNLRERSNSERAGGLESRVVPGATCNGRGPSSSDSFVLVEKDKKYLDPKFLKTRMYQTSLEEDVSTILFLIVIQSLEKTEKLR